MGKKRLTFTLLVNEKGFLLSKNFRLQVVGDLEWLDNNYMFRNCASSIDELIIINTSVAGVEWESFRDIVKYLSKNCFIPIASGGGIRSIEDADRLFSVGIDKIILNHCLTFNHSVVKQIANKYGRQAVVGSIDFKLKKNKYYYRVIDKDMKVALKDIMGLQNKFPITEVGELLLTSVDRDGTGHGMDTKILKLFDEVECPIILSGGAGTSEHLAEALNHPQVDAVSTANLYNFIGDSLMNARSLIKKKGIQLAAWQ